MILFLIRLALIGVATSLTALGIADVSADGETVTIRVGPLADWLAAYATEAGIGASVLWAAMWTAAKKWGAMT